MKTGKTVAIILAGGRGNRMGGEVKKQYMQLAGRPLIAHTLRAFQEYDGVDEIVLVTSQEGFSAEGRQNGVESLKSQQLCDGETWKTVSEKQRVSASEGSEEELESGDVSETMYVKKDIIEKYGFTKVRAVVPGGAERYHSVYAGLMACCSDVKPSDQGTLSVSKVFSMSEPTYVLIHDGARAFISKQVLDHVMEGLQKSEACVAAVPVKDTIKKADSDAVVTQTLNRKELYAMQTPQAFSYDLVMSAYRQLIEEEREGGEVASAHNKAFVTDDAMVVEKYDPKQKILLVEGSYDNIKVTTPDDLLYGEFLLGQRMNGQEL